MHVFSGPGPGRGRYDRSVPPRQRRRDTRRRVLAAAALLRAAAPDEPIPVQPVCTLAGIGRNTFYALFPSRSTLNQALHRHAAGRLRAVLHQPLRDAATPLEQLRGLAQVWIWIGADSDPLIRASLCLADPVGTSVALVAITTALESIFDAAHRVGLVGQRPSPQVLRLAAAVWERGALDQMGDADVPRATPADLVDATLRLVR